MATGKVKFFSDQKGYGFITPDEGGDDVFVHKSALDASGLVTLQTDQRVEFEKVPDQKKGKFKADRIKHLPSR